MKGSSPTCSIVVPIYNRIINLECVLLCLARQTVDSESFEVIIADDGSKENILSLVRKFGDALNIKYFWQPDKGIRVAMVRNRGASLAAKSVEDFIFLDSDVIVKEDWLFNYNKLRKEYPGVVICGRYDYLKPMRIFPQMVVSNFDDIISNRFPSIKVSDLGVQGPDPRSNKINGMLQAPTNKFGTGILGGNLLVPKKVFFDSGGFDEKFVGHDGEDAEYNYTLIEMGYLGMYSEKVIGWHIWHFVDQKAREESLERNIEYMVKKHGIDKLSFAAFQEKYFIVHKGGTLLMNPINRLFRRQIRKRSLKNN